MSDGKGWSRRDFLAGWLRRGRDHLRVLAEPASEQPRWPPLRPRPPAEPPPFVRPPGALDEAEFLAACSRSGDCAMACPVQAIVPLGPAYGTAIEGTPAYFPRATACVLCEDLPCVRACPSGALRPVAIDRLRMGLAELRRQHCLAAQGEDCADCVRACPVAGALTRVDGEPRVDPELCTGCGRCEEVCPTEPAAIVVRPHLAGRVTAV